MFKYSTCTVLNNVDNASATDTQLSIKWLGNFKKTDITKVYKRNGDEGAAGTATLACVASTVPSTGTAETAAGVYRLKLYVKLSGSNNAYYANDFVFKGKPYAYEFAIGTSGTGGSLVYTWKKADGTQGSNATAATAIAEAAKEAINKMSKRFNDLVFEVSTDGSNLTITVAGKDAKYISITECTLQKFDATVNSPLVGGEYVFVAEGTKTACVNPFGTYGEIIKDLRLPTPEHTGWASLMADEMPVMGQTYNQYIIYICKDRGIMGGDAVGQPAKSVTAHSIWVPQIKTTGEGGAVTISDALVAKLATLSLTNGVMETYDAAKLSNTQEDTPASAFAEANEADLVK